MEGAALPEYFELHCAAKIGENIAVAGGFNSGSAFYQFGWETQTWTKMPDLPEALHEHGCEIIETERGQELWVMGGVQGGYVSASVYTFNFDTRQWSTGVPLPRPRAGFSTVVIDNSILVIGGEDKFDAYPTIFAWNHVSNEWEEREAGLSGPRSYFGATLVDERSGISCT